MTSSVEGMGFGQLYRQTCTPPSVERGRVLVQPTISRKQSCAKFTGHVFACHALNFHLWHTLSESDISNVLPMAAGS